MKKVLKDYSEFIKDTKLVGIRLTGHEFTRKPSYFEHEFKDLVKSMTYQVNEIIEGEDHIYPQVIWILSFKKGNKLLAKIKSTYEVAYTLSEHFNDDVIDLFVDNVVKPVTYPYFRQQVNSISNDAYLNIPPLPMLKLIPNSGPADEYVDK